MHYDVLIMEISVLFVKVFLYWQTILKIDFDQY